MVTPTKRAKIEKNHASVKTLPRKSVYRLLIYQRCLDRLSVETVSSEALARAAGVKPTQLRKDLTYLGQFGTRGLGYNVRALSDAINEMLGRTGFQPVILVGAGNLGRALLRYEGFRKEGFEISRAFDVDPDKFENRTDIKTTVSPLSEMGEFIEKNQVRMAILCVPAREAQSIANDMVGFGIQAILNFTPTVLEVPDNVTVNSVDLAIELENLSYFVQ